MSAQPVHLDHKSSPPPQDDQLLPHSNPPIKLSSHDLLTALATSSASIAQTQVTTIRSQMSAPTGPFTQLELQDGYNLATIETNNSFPDSAHVLTNDCRDKDASRSRARYAASKSTTTTADQGSAPHGDSEDAGSGGEDAVTTTTKAPSKAPPTGDSEHSQDDPVITTTKASSELSLQRATTRADRDKKASDVYAELAKSKEEAARGNIPRRPRFDYNTGRETRTIEQIRSSGKVTPWLYNKAKPDDSDTTTTTTLKRPDRPIVFSNTDNSGSMSSFDSVTSRPAPALVTADDDNDLVALGSNIPKKAPKPFDPFDMTDGEDILAFTAQIASQKAAKKAAKRREQKQKYKKKK